MFDESRNIAFIFNDEDLKLVDAASTLSTCPVMLHGRCLIHASRYRRQVSGE
jgi:hypothetical protein